MNKKLNILFVSEHYPSVNRPNYCVYLEQQVSALRDLGHNVEVLIPKFSIEQKEKDRYIQNGLKVTQVFLKLTNFKKRTGFYNFDCFDFSKFDVVSLHLGDDIMLYKIANRCKKLNIPTVRHFHGLNVWRDYYAPIGLKNKVIYLYLYAIKRLTYYKSNAVVGVSDKVCEIAKKHIKKSKVYKVYNGVDISRCEPLCDKKSDREINILCVANLIKIKGQKFLIKAVSDLIKRNYNVKLSLIGIGPEENNLKQLARDLDLEKHVTFLGEKKYDEVIKSMQTCDMFIMPSFFEAFGCVFVEAMSCGALTVGCKNTGADEIIQSEENGFLIEQKSSEAISEIVERVIKNPENAKTVANQGVTRAKDFTWDNSAKELQKVYEHIL